MSSERDWLKNIPTNWGRKKLKYVVSLKSGSSITSEEIGSSGEYPVFGGNGIRGYASAYTHCGNYVLIGRQGALCGNINYASGCFWASEHAVVAELREKAEVIWLGELLRSMNLNQYSQSAAQPGIAVDVIANLEVPVPPLQEQRKIASYLDRETAKVDALISAKERLRGILAEKRQALITRYVTRGLEPCPSLWDSGVPWLGKIPAHWRVERSRWLFRERDLRSESGLEELLTVSHITGVTPRSDKDVNMFEAESTEGYKICLAGDLVINTLWAWMGAMGVAPVNGIVSPAYNVYQLDPRLEPTYVDALVRIPIFAQDVIRYSKGVWSSRLRLYPEGFFEVFFPLPPINEQLAIVAKIGAESSKLDRLSLATERTIELLKERREALVKTAVTGQMHLV